MANKIVLKKSSVPSKAPIASDLDYGELALNYADGKLYFKNSDNNIAYFGSDTSAFVTLTGTQTLTNKTLTSPTISGGTINNAVIGGTTPAAITGTDIVATASLKSSFSSGDEGGEILLAKPQTNTTLVGTGVTIDVYQNKIRFFEQGGDARGVYIDLTAATGGAGTNLLSAGSGDVVGPSSSTDNALTRFDSTTGKLIQNSQVILDDNGNTSGINAITFDTTPSTLPTAEGTLFWDSADGNQTLSLIMAGGSATQQIGQEQYFRIKASSAIANGQVIMFTGTVGSSGGLTGAPATGLTASTASYVMGIATQSIAENSWGYVTSFGVVRQIDTSAFTDGAILYLDPTTPGGLTTAIPSAPNAKVQVCAVVHAALNGALFVRPSFGGILGQYEGDVGISNPANGELLIRNQTSGKWVNSSLTAGTGINITNAAGSITINNTGPKTTYSASAPSSPSAGDKWIDSDNGIEYVYVNDDDSSQWIETAISFNTSLPSGGTANQVLVKNTSTDYDVTWGTFNKSLIGLGNVENTALSTYSGSSYITTVGNLISGTWNADTIQVNKGGTGQVSLTSGYVILGNGTNPVLTLAPGSSGNVLKSNGTAWTSGTLSKSEVGLGNVENTALSTWAGSTNITTIGAATATSLTVTGDLTVNGTTTTINSTTIAVDDKNIELGSVASPTDTTADGGGITLKGATDKTFNWVNATSAWTSSEHIALAAGKDIILNGLTSGSITLIAPDVANSTTITLPATTGTVITTGDTGTVTNTMLAGSITTGKITGLAASATTDTTNAANITSGTLPNARLSAIPNSALANSTISGISLGSNLSTLTISTGLSGTSYNGSSAVTIALASAYGDTTNPYASKTANYFLAAPNGTAGAPTFRAIVAADIPTLNQNTTGSAGSVTNSVTFTNSGGAAAGTTYNGSAARTIDYSTVGAAPAAGNSSITTVGTIGTGTWQATVVDLAYGGTGKTTAPAALANLMGLTSTATAGGTTTLTNTSTYQQIFTGSTTQTITLPNVTTLALGWTFEIINNSTGNLTVNSSGGNLVGTIYPSTSTSIVCTAITGTTASSWDFDYNAFATVTGTGACVLATSPALTTPNIGAATGTSLSVSGSLTSTVATGTAPLVVSSTTKVANLNAETVDGIHIEVVASMPGSPAANTLYIVTG